MPSCELCGKQTDSVEKTKIEGATLKVCSSCSEMGEKVETRSQKKKRTGKSSKPRTEKVLVEDYGSRIKQAREDEGISVQELADDLNEKSSLISKLEREDLKPDNSLAKKLADRLDVKLYTNPEVVSYDSPDTDSRSATLEDVAEVKD